MAKKFDIHEWQANQKLKHYLAEQEDFTPDLEDDELKRRAIQQMMSTEKGPQKDDYKLVNSVSNIADVYSYGEILDALESFYTKNDEQQSAEMARKHAKEFRDFLDSEKEYPDFLDSKEEDPYDALTKLDELEIKKVIDQSMDNDAIGKLQDVIRNYDLGKVLNTIAVIIDRTGGMPEIAQKIADLVPGIEQKFNKDGSKYVLNPGEEDLDEANVTGTSTSFTTGPSGTGPYATPKAFGKSKKKKGPFNTKSGYMGYTEPVKN